ADCTRRAVERGEHSIARSVDLPAAVSVDRITGRGQKRCEQVAPTPVTEIHGLLGGSYEVDKKHRGEHAVRAGDVTYTGQELLRLAEDLLVLARPEQMIVPGKLNQACSRDVLGKVATATHVDQAIARAVKDQSRHLDRRQDRADVDIDIHAVKRDRRGRACTVPQKRRPGVQKTFVVAEARREDLRREGLTPVTNNLLHRAFVGLARGGPGIVVGAYPACVAAVRDQSARTLWKGRREERAERSALRESEERSSFGGGGIH